MAIPIDEGCNDCHKRKDKAFSRKSRSLLKRIILDDQSDKRLNISKPDISENKERIFMAKLFPVNFNIFLGDINTAQKRRQAYLRAFKKAGKASLGEWAREILDKAANFEDSK